MSWAARKSDAVDPRVLVKNSAEQERRGLVYDRVRKAYARLRAQATEGWVFSDGEVEVVACPFSDLFNGLLSPSWPEESVESCWRRALSWHKRTGQDMYLSLGPSSSPAGLGEIAKRDGFHCCSVTPYMYLNLEDLKESMSLNGLRVERIEDFSFFEKHQHPWLGPLNTPYRELKLRFLRRHGEGASRCLWQFVALYHRRLVGAATIFSHEKEVAVFDVVVKKEYRNRGIGTRLTGEACRFARDIGMRSVGLGASGKGVGMYRKLGFLDAGLYQDYCLPERDLATFV